MMLYPFVSWRDAVLEVGCVVFVFGSRGRGDPYFVLPHDGGVSPFVFLEPSKPSAVDIPCPHEFDFMKYFVYIQPVIS